MKLIIETCLDSYLVAVVKNDKVVNHIYYKELKKKSDELDKDVQKLIGKDTNKLTGVYVTEGPGSFMGVRAGLLYGYTLAKVLGIDFYTTSSLNFVSNGNKDEVFIDAKSNQSFHKIFPNGKESLVDFKPSSIFDINNFLENPSIYLDMFKKTEKLRANYLKEPRVG